MRYVSVIIPADVSVTVAEGKISVKGAKGTVKKEFRLNGITIVSKDKKIEVDGKNLGMINTVKRQILKMFEGCTVGFSKKMIIRYSHFPIKVSIKGNVFVIDNFGGEKLQRKANIIGDTKVKIAGQEIHIDGPSNDDVSQTVANIRQVTRTKKKDSRVFQDGIYQIE